MFELNLNYWLKKSFNYNKMIFLKFKYGIYNFLKFCFDLFMFGFINVKKYDLFMVRLLNDEEMM